MTENPHDKKIKIANKFLIFSEKYHKMSLLFYELSQSLKIKSKELNLKEFKEYIKKDLNLDFEKIEKITKAISDIKLSDLKGGREK